MVQRSPDRIYKTELSLVIIIHSKENNDEKENVSFPHSLRKSTSGNTLSNLAKPYKYDRFKFM